MYFYLRKMLIKQFIKYNFKLEYVIIFFFVIFNIVFIKTYSSTMLHNYFYLFFIIFFISRIKALLRGYFKTDIYINTQEGYYLYFSQSTKKILSQKIIELLINTFFIDLAICLIMFWYANYRMTLTSFLLFMSLIIFDMVCRLTGTMIYKTKKIKEIFRFLNNILNLSIAVIVILLLNSQFLETTKKYIIYFASASIKISYINIVYIEMFLIFLLILTSILYFKICTILDLEPFLKYGSIKSRINVLYKISMGNPTISQEVEKIIDTVYGESNYINKLLNKYYYTGWGAILFKNLIYILTRRGIDWIIMLIDLYIGLMAYKYSSSPLLGAAAIIYIILMFPNKINNFIFNDLENKDYMRLLPIYPSEFAKGYLTIPIILSSLVSIFLSIIILSSFKISVLRFILVYIFLFISFFISSIFCQLSIFEKYTYKNSKNITRIIKYIFSVFISIVFFIYIQKGLLYILIFFILFGLIIIHYLYKIYLGNISNVITNK